MAAFTISFLRKPFIKKEVINIFYNIFLPIIPALLQKDYIKWKKQNKTFVLVPKTFFNALKLANSKSIITKDILIFFRKDFKTVYKFS